MRTISLPLLRLVPSLVIGLSLLSASRASAQLDPGTTESRSGTTPPLSSPNYSTTLPSYFTAGNQIDSTGGSYFGSPMGFSLTSTVFRNPDTGFLGFDYTISMGLGSDSVIGLGLDNSSHPWQGIGITLAGSTASGHSTSAGGSPSWTDGAPIFIGRDTTPNGEGITISFRNGNEGTALFSGDGSAEMFFDTTATSYQSGSLTLMFSSFPNATADGAIFVPTTVPEPGGGLLALGGVLAVMALRRTRVV